MTEREQHGWTGPTCEHESCSGQVRWNGDRLEQLWIITTVTAGNGSVGLVLSRRAEWREVPRIVGEKGNDNG